MAICVANSSMGHHERKNYRGNLLWQSSLTLLGPVARRLAEAGRKVLVLEKRPVVNGNMRCECVDGAPWEEKLLW